MSEIINLTDILRIRRVNSLNVIVEIKSTDENSNTKWREANGSGRGPFLQTEADACVWVLNHGLVDKGGETDLREAVKQYEAAAKRLARSVSKSLDSGN